MPTVIATALGHIWRVIAVGLAAALIWAVLSLPLGLILVPYISKSGVTVGTMVFVCAMVTFVGAGYISARYISPGSLAHAGVAGFLVTFVWTLWSSHGPWYFGFYFCLAAAALALVGALIGRRKVRAA